MKKTALIGLFLLLLQTYASAETKFVHEVMKVTLRTGPGTDHKIITMIESGQQVEVVEKGDEWTRVSLPDGREGFVLNRFLTDKTPTVLLLKNLERKHENLTNKHEALLEKTEQIKEENKQLQGEFSTLQKKYNDMSKAYENLKKGSADFFSLKENYETASVQLEKQSQRTEILTEKLKQKYIQFFAFGAGVLLLGIIIGFISRGGRKQSSLY